MTLFETDISPRARETYNALRDRIKDLPCGVPLPPLSDIRRELGVGQATVEKAFVMLEAQGLIERKPRKGVFVADRTATGEMAIVLKPQLFGAEASQAYRMTCTALTEALNARNPRWNIKMHLGKVVTNGKDFPATLDILEPAILPRLRGIFTFHPLYDLEQKLERVNVPVIHINGMSRMHGGIYHVAGDHKDFFQQSVRHLKDVGCRSIGMLWKKNVNMKQDLQTDYPRIVSELAAMHGLECRTEWMPFQVPDGTSGVTEQDGYDLFMCLWKQSEKPDGVIVVDDVLCKGVLRAILQLGVKLPEDIQLITYANKGVPLPFHKPVTRIEFDVEAQAECAVEMMDGLVGGLKPKSDLVLLTGKLMKGNIT